ncbi:MAG: alpha/beta hydrolase [Gordonia sp. (in: high G+C Gram-positive bacteria)]
MNSTSVSAGVSTRRAEVSRAVNRVIWRAPKPMITAASRVPFIGGAGVRAFRPALNASLAAVSPVPRGVRSTPVDVRTAAGRVRGEWIHEHGSGRLPDPASGRSILYYLHGSGYVICSPRTHRGLISRLTRRSGIGAFSLDYRLGPDHHFPAGGDDTVRGYRWLLGQGWSADQIIVAGDSAGGHLAQDLLAANHRDGVPQPTAMLLISPLYDPAFDVAAALERSGVSDPYIDVGAAKRFLRMYTGDAAADHPRMKIALTPDMDLPDTLIQVGGREVMADDARAIHRNLLSAGGTSTLQIWPGQGHVFQMFPYFTPDSRTAVREAKDFLDRHVR